MLATYIDTSTVFLRSDAMATIFFAAHIHSLGKPTDINDGWIRCVRAIQLRLYVTLEKELYNTNSPSSSPLTVVRICARVSHTLATATIRGRRLFEGDDYSRAASI